MNKETLETVGAVVITDIIRFDHRIYCEIIGYDLWFPVVRVCRKCQS